MTGLKSWKVLLSGLLAVAALVGIQDLLHLRWFWYILVPLAIDAVWLAFQAYADHLVSQGRYDQALRLVPLAAISGAGRNCVRGNVLMDAGRYEEAERRLRETIDHVGVIRVDRALALEDLGNVLIETGRFEEAQRCFQNAADIYPNRSPWASGMAETLLRQGIYPQNALTHAEKALSLFQSGMERISDRWRLGAILATRAWALASCGRGAEAREAIDAALNSPARKTKTRLAQVHYKAGMSLLALCDDRGANEHFCRGAELDPAGRWGRLCAGAVQHR